jgi:hypothetical protein
MMITRPFTRSIADAWQRMHRDPQQYANALWVLIAVVMLWGLLYTPPTTGDRLGLRRFRTPIVAGGARVAEQFVMRERNLTGVEIRPAVMGPVSGALRVTLTDLTSGKLVRVADIPAADLVRDRSFVFAVGRIADSRGHWFELAIASSPEQPAGGIAFWATRGDRLDNAMLLINGVERWADLAFQSHTPLTSVLGLLLRSSGTDRVRQAIVLAGLVAIWLLVGVVLRMLATGRAEALVRGRAT